MKHGEVQRVLKGLSLIAQQFVQHAAPPTRLHAQQLTAHTKDLVKLSPHIFDHYNHVETDLTGPVVRPPLDAVPPHLDNHNPAAASTLQGGATLVDIDEVPEHLAREGVADSARASFAGPELPRFDEEDAKLVDDHPAFEERSVPAHPVSRVLGFGQLAVGMVLGAAGEVVKRGVGLSTPSPEHDSVVMSEANAERLTRALCKMRGAALKLGQMLSMQDDTTLPPVWKKILERVRQEANIMPMKQLQRVMETELGEDWRDKFERFDDEPMAAASIGQVHHAVLPSGDHVAVKVQYPGVANSIDSDLDNLQRLIKVYDVFPPGLYVDEIVDVARTELKEECDYLLEAKNQERYRELIENDPYVNMDFVVPKVEMDLCTESVLTSQLVPGVAIDKAAELGQEERDNLGRRLLQLTLQELFVYRFMQTDPNWGNFLYDKRRDRVALLDFGAAREFSEKFVDNYLRIVWAAANDDRDTFHSVSKDMGILTGYENEDMVKAHIDAGFIVGEPFASYEPFDFASADISRRLQEHASVFAKHRLTPPPQEIYSLHRRLSGAFFMCIHLKARFSAREALERVVAEHAWD